MSYLILLRHSASQLAVQGSFGDQVRLHNPLLFLGTSQTSYIRVIPR